MSTDERALAESAQNQLEEAGFFVTREVEHARRGVRVRADIVAYASDESGALKPEIVVEVKRGLGKLDRSSALAQLSRSALAFDTPRAYLFDGSWYEVDPTFTEAHETVQPRPNRAPTAGPAELTQELLQPSIRRALWNVAATSRGKKSQPWDFSVGMMHDVLGLVGHQFQRWTEQHPIDRWRIAKTIASELAAARFGAIRLPVVLADGMANLLAADSNWQIEDPACGIGTLLLSVGDRGFRRDSPVLLFGTDRDERMLDLARLLIRFAGSDLNLTPIVPAADKRANLNGAISFGPIGGKRAERFQLPSGQWTRDEDVVALSSLVSRLAPAGRMVFGTATRLLFSKSLEEYRRYLAQTYRIVAVVELPPRSMDGTSIAPAVVVIEKSKPGDTLIARLEDDWATQLSEKGDFYNAYTAHLQRP